MKKILLFVVVLSFVSITHAQRHKHVEDDTTKAECLHSSLDLGNNNSGISFGNSQNWSGLRFNFSDCDVENINGINITLWKPKEPLNSTINGLSLGLAPSAARMRGLSIGIAAVVATKELSGLNLGGFAVVSNNSAEGINFGGLAVVSNRDAAGLNLGGLAVVANRDLYGFNFGGIATVSNGDMQGINLGGIAVVSTEDITGLSLAIGAIVSKGSISGVNVVGYKTEADDFEGVNIACGWSEINNFTGFSVSGYHRITGRQTGLVIGLFNSTDELDGIQIGILNIARNNSGIFKVLPLFNAHFD
jgi:hypothetical protein